MRIHWFSITLFCSYDMALAYYDTFFSLELGPLTNTPRGGRGFQNIDVALNEFKLYYNPVPQSGDIIKDYCHFEFTGSACDSVLPIHFQEFIHYLDGVQVLYKVTRLDLAWDGVPFSPREFYENIYNDKVVTCAKRETLSYTTSPFQLRDDGSEGCDTAYIGSRQSARFARVYNKRGLTRFEIVFKDIRSHAVTLDLFSHAFIDWDIVGREHVLDYLDFPEWSAWLKFVANAYPADCIVSSARRVSLSKIRNWLDRQVSVALSVFYDVHGYKQAQAIIDRMILEASASRDRSRYQAVLQSLSIYKDGHVSLSQPADFDYLDSLDAPLPMVA